MKRTTWAKPTLIRKPVSETAQGLGSNIDSIGGEQPYTPPTSP
jgi:hypothetical protein